MFGFKDSYIFGFVMFIFLIAGFMVPRAIKILGLLVA
jgi:hypothetical protein